MMIDTDYISILDVDSNIRHYYSEETRERVVGYTEPTEEGESSPITETYTVVVLNQPDEVTYQDVQQRRGERKPWLSVVKPELARAIEWEDFQVNHGGYLAWKEAYALWEQEQPTEEVFDEETQEYVTQVAAAPVRPEVDMANRREVYEVITDGYDSNLEVFTGSYSEFVNDVEYTVTKTPDTDPKSAEEIAEYYSALAIESRYNAIYEPLEHNGVLFDMGKGRDGIYGITNFKDVITAAVADPSKENETIHWIAADNSVVPLSFDDVRAIVTAFGDRQQVIFLAYATWRGGDKQSAFTM